MPDHKQTKTLYEQNRDELQRIQGELQKLKSNVSIDSKLRQAITDLAAVVSALNGAIHHAGIITTGIEKPLHDHHRVITEIQEMERTLEELAAVERGETVGDVSRGMTKE
jgi:DNA-binding FrmR family transcriptional regulator